MNNNIYIYIMYSYNIYKETLLVEKCPIKMHLSETETRTNSYRAYYVCISSYLAQYIILCIGRWVKWRAN